MDEGYIKFRANWHRQAAWPASTIAGLNLWRDRLYGLGLLGAYPNGIGFGNISQRWNAEGQFIISGSTTGNYAVLGPEHYTLVTEVELDNNLLHCTGPIIASSESMSHAAVYLECPWVNAVFHVHHQKMWEKLLHKVPTTAVGVTYGTPEMAYSIMQLLQETDLPERRIFVMEGHPEGIFSFGRNLDEAGEVLIRMTNFSNDE
ncbi:class II aldolase/adducin family protein [Haliscomenobacter hydrossis]|uniref:Class II aldolase/adducin family protein n=1 Tax=Haliscomenobacter hydrossis (strain ATCC 27775 / DSM 1100 / LMG 10767 / O) TaxID=760192 RepID=F4KZU0_HALH1|nr:class II aldolase/adducin family protein [Haliscomenobacter hydrossis]AEE50526.1 class II aldolase/adducin family protein [Haliscomenobacter hydrossis DSM 1100]